MDDASAMAEAIEQARIAASGTEPDVPVGAVVVQGSEIIGRGRNRVEELKDPTAHAEVVAIRDAVSTAGAKRLVGATLYVTLEPCLMCAGAIVQARIDRVVFGCDDPRAGAVRSLYTVLSDPRLNHRCRIGHGVLEHECSELLTKFFEKLRDRGPRTT